MGLGAVGNQGPEPVTGIGTSRALVVVRQDDGTVAPARLAYPRFTRSRSAAFRRGTFRPRLRCSAA